MTRICAFPGCKNETPLNTVRGKKIPRRWCWHHLDGAGEQERKEYAKTIILQNSNYRHGMKGTRPYGIWLAMKARCNRKTTINYKHYGGKGISYDPRWNDFSLFWQDMAEGYADNLTIDRKDSTKNYSKENCRWVTIQQQQLNKGSNRIIEYEGKKQAMAEWEKELGFKRGVIRQRLDTYGWSIEKALTKPLRNKRKQP